MKNRIWNQKGASMLLIVCIFLVLAVLGTNLLNAANANVSNTKTEYDKEQTMLYVSSVYEIVNDMVESGDFSDSTGSLPSKAETTASQPFLDGNNQDVKVSIAFQTTGVPIIADITVTCKNPSGQEESYTIRSTYSRTGELGKFTRNSCKGLIE